MNELRDASGLVPPVSQAPAGSVPVLRQESLPPWRRLHGRLVLPHAGRCPPAQALQGPPTEILAFRVNTAHPPPKTQNTRHHVAPHVGNTCER